MENKAIEFLLRNKEFAILLLSRRYPFSQEMLEKYKNKLDEVGLNLNRSLTKQIIEKEEDDDFWDSSVCEEDTGICAVCHENDCRSSCHSEEERHPRCEEHHERLPCSICEMIRHQSEYEDYCCEYYGWMLYPWEQPWEADLRSLMNEYGISEPGKDENKIEETFDEIWCRVFNPVLNDDEVENILKKSNIDMVAFVAKYYSAQMKEQVSNTEGENIFIKK
jgi:hypothetical protein